MAEYLLYLSLNKLIELVETRVDKYEAKRICYYFGEIRFTGPICPLVNKNIISVGESAGLVIPYLGAGIYSAANSALIVARAIAKGDFSLYEKQIAKKYTWLHSVRKFGEGIEGNPMHLGNLRSILNTARYMGMEIKPRNLYATLRILGHIRREF